MIETRSRSIKTRRRRDVGGPDSCRTPTERPSLVLEEVETPISPPSRRPASSNREARARRSGRPRPPESGTKGQRVSIRSPNSMSTSAGWKAPRSNGRSRGLERSMRARGRPRARSRAAGRGPHAPPREPTAGRRRSGKWGWSRGQGEAAPTKRPTSPRCQVLLPRDSARRIALVFAVLAEVAGIPAEPWSPRSFCRVSRQTLPVLSASRMARDSGL